MTGHWEYRLHPFLYFHLPPRWYAVSQHIYKFQVTSLNSLVGWFVLHPDHLGANCSGCWLMGAFQLEPVVLICFVISELLLEVGGRVSHGLVLVWFELCVLCQLFLDNTLQSPGQECSVSCFVVIIELRYGGVC